MSRRRALRITGAAGVALALGGGLGRELLRRARLHRVVRNRPGMGTRVTITVVDEDGEVARRSAEAGFAEVERLEALLSGYRPDTPVACLAREGVVHEAPAELLEVLTRAQRWAVRTGGAFDVTVAPLVALYRTRASEGGGLPTEAEVREVMELVDYRALEIDGRKIALRRPGMAITLDAIAKGYVLDRTLAVLVARGVGGALVEAGGDLAVTDGEDPDGWSVGIQDPHDPAGLLGTFRPGRRAGAGVASSGDYVQAFSADRGVHHILDPRTGRSPEDVSGTTVVATDATDADALSTAAFVLGPVEGLALLEELDGVEGLVVAKDGRRFATAGFPATSFHAPGSSDQPS